MLERENVAISGPTEWFTKMFTSTDHIFEVATTWQYMVVIPVALLALTLVIALVYRVNGQDTPDSLKGLVMFPAFIIFLIGSAYYVLVLIKIILASI